mmetsp:Transcript_19072/g.33116  ORF Transcript_19072/g.33116 Transcript_19072/m.33116 type:complete len:212 (-) Transcript_19072:18-653(-)
MTAEPCNFVRRLWGNRTQHNTQRTPVGSPPAAAVLMVGAFRPLEILPGRVLRGPARPVARVRRCQCGTVVGHDGHRSWLAVGACRSGGRVAGPRPLGPGLEGRQARVVATRAVVMLVGREESLVASGAGQRVHHGGTPRRHRSAVGLLFGSHGAFSEIHPSEEALDARVLQLVVVQQLRAVGNLIEHLHGHLQLRTRETPIGLHCRAKKTT